MVSKHDMLLKVAARCASGTAMADETGKVERQAAPRAGDSRQDRLKTALRENLKRRKMQARERDKNSDMSSNDHKASPHGELGKRGD
jgi:hypothetical protein